MLERMKRGLAGRSGRGEYWLSLAGLIVGNVVLSLLLPPVLVSLVSLPFWLFIAGRRLHDFNARIGWALIPFGMSFVLGFARSFAVEAGFSEPFSADIAQAVMVVVTLVVGGIIGVWPPTTGENRFGFRKG